jgi:hypothetical protein
MPDGGPQSTDDGFGEASELPVRRRPTPGRSRMADGSPQSADSNDGAADASEFPARRRPTPGRGRMADGGPQNADDGIVD